MFKKYRVHVGISLDGPDEMNDTRWAGSLEKTREATRKSFEAIKKCLDNKLSLGLIITIHKKNGLPKYRERFKAWIKELQSWGVDGARLHPLEIDHSSVGETLALTPEQNIEFLLDMWDFEISELNVPGKKSFQFDIFRDVEYMLRADDDGFERQMALYNTPQEHGGCQGCRFFIMCKSHCPGTGADMDWRNRTDTCMNWKVAFSIYERMMVERGEMPLSLDPKLKRYEDILMYGYSRGAELRLEHIKKYLDPNIGFDIERYIQSYLMNQAMGGHKPHADHTDETGRYALEFKEKYGYLP